MDPSIPLAVQWLDRQTLVAVPAPGVMLPSTRYKVKLTGELAKRTGGFEFSFVNHPLEVEGVWGTAIDRLPPSPTLPIHFNQPVVAREVIRHCRLMGAPGSMPGLFTVKDPAQIAEVIEVQPATALTQGVEYQLTCEELTGSVGKEPLADAFSQALHTYPTFSVVNVGPDGHDVPADDVDVKIKFATPVDLDALKKHLRAKPAIPGLTRGALDADGTTYQVTVNFEVQTDYRITVEAGLTDVFAQKLAKPVTHDFHTGDARPRISLETGIFALEPSMAATRCGPAASATSRSSARRCRPRRSPRCSPPRWTTTPGTTPRTRAWSPGRSSASRASEEGHHRGRQEQLAPREDPARQGLRRRPARRLPRRLLVARRAGGSGSHVGLSPQPARARQRHRDGRAAQGGSRLRPGLGDQHRDRQAGRRRAGADLLAAGQRGVERHHRREGHRHLPGTTRLLKQATENNHQEVDPEGEEDYYSYRSQRLIAVVEKNGDVAAVDGNWSNGIQTWNFGVEEDRQSGETQVRGLLQSDRGIYRRARPSISRAGARDRGRPRRPACRPARRSRSP
jgi:hypothetical protein